MYFLQNTLLSLEELQEMELDNCLILLFSLLDLTTYTKELTSSLPQGAPPHDRGAIIRAFLAAPLEGIDTFSALNILALN